MKFLIFQFDEQAFDFLGIIHFIKVAFPFSQILLCATIFATHYLFSFGDVYLLSSLSKNNKIKEWEDI